MEGKLKQFLFTRAEKPKDKEVVISTNIVDEKGKPIPFKIRPLTLDEHGEAQQKAIKTNMMGKKKDISFNSGKYNVHACLCACLEPNFNDASLIKELGVITPEQALGKLLLPGEINELASQISELSGFNQDLNDDIEEAKN